ncbi:MAG: metal ABC transporter permease [Victivallaceae bacterium]|nr:metal ABC transporter permease [Victivallaceae bacterium]
MTKFLVDLMDPSMGFLRASLLVGVLGSVAFGAMGTLVIIRRITSLAGAIAHAVLGGVGAALYFQRVWHVSWLTPMTGAMIAAVLAALIIGTVSLCAREREDTVIGVVWAFGMAIGLVFLARTPGYVDLQGYLFGNILLVSEREVYATILLDLAVLVPLVLFYNGILAVVFDDTYAELRGARVKLIYFMVLVMTALTIVVMVNVAGIILVIALLTLPAATAGLFAKNVWSMMILATLLGMLFTSTGMAASYLTDLPSGAMVVLLAGAVYLFSLLYRHIRR